MPAQLSPEVEAAINSNNMFFAVLILLVLVSLVGVLLVYRIALQFSQYVRTLTCLNNPNQRFFKLPSRPYGALKQHLFDAPLFNCRHNKQMRIGPIEAGILPTRFQALLLTSIITMNTVMWAYGIEWRGPIMTTVLHLGNRAGTMAVVNMIPLVIISGRNNPLIWLLNISFDNFNLMHRWFGRIVVVLATSHGIAETMVIVISQKKNPMNKDVPGIHLFSEALKEAEFIVWGVVTLTAMIAIILTSWTAFRHAFYETFLHIHIAMVALILAALWVHLEEDAPPQHNWIKIIITIWVIERVIRLGSLLYRNLGRSTTRASIEALPGDAMRVTLQLARPWRFLPGQHVYLTIPSIGLWTSHPFSVAWSEALPRSAHDIEKGLSEQGTTVQNTDLLALPQTTISLIIRRRVGFTEKMFAKAYTSPSGRAILPALIEGPYGTTHSLSSYGSVMLIAGGIGISHLLPHARALLAGHASATVAARRVLLVWVIRSPEHLEWIRPWVTEMLAMEKRRDILRIQIFVTRPRSTKEIHSPTSTVQMFPGKPDVDALVGTETREMVGAMGVAVCGPGGLADDVRWAVRRRQGSRNIDLLEEGFGW